MCKLLVPGDRFGAFGEEFIVLDINKAKSDILCIRIRPWKRAPFDEKTERDCTNNFAEATIRSMLSHVFYGSMVEQPDDVNFFVRMNANIIDNFGRHHYDGIYDYVRILTQHEMVKYREYLDIKDWAWTMTPLKCRNIFTKERQTGDQGIVIADSYGRWGHKKACYPADIYPVVTFRQRITRHSSFYLKIK